MTAVYELGTVLKGSTEVLAGVARGGASSTLRQALGLGLNDETELTLKITLETELTTANGDKVALQLRIPLVEIEPNE